MSLKNKVAIITGGSAGYGLGIAEVMHKKGCKVWIISRDENKLKKSASTLGVNYLVCDISNPADWDNVVKKVMESHKRIDILINNAGSGIAIKNLIEQTDEEIYSSIMVNLVGHIYGIKRISRIMCEQKEGMIINISSVCADHAWPGWSVYSAAKSGIEMLARSLHNEFRNYNVHITTLTPSWGDTDFLTEAKLKNWTEDISKKIMKPKEMGDLIVKICTIKKHLSITKIRVQPMIQEINPM